SLSSVDHAIWLAPDNCILYSDRGDLYKLYGHTDWAMREYARALEVDAMCVSAREARASAYNDMKRYDDAITDLNEAIRLRESEPGGVWEKHLLISGLRVRGDLYMVQKRYNLAISDYTDMIGMSTSDEADTYRKRAIAYMSEHEYQKALDSLQPYLVKNQHPTSEILMLIEQLNGLLKSQP
ncbi:MAG TPA: hypothetical protein VLH19_00730, partial [Patescibacteria group bacterium]|nr:hypothetical protein [Patescibacteria group bacterium]